MKIKEFLGIVDSALWICVPSFYDFISGCRKSHYETIAYDPTQPSFKPVNRIHKYQNSSHCYTKLFIQDFYIPENMPNLTFQ